MAFAEISSPLTQQEKQCCEEEIADTETHHREMIRVVADKLRTQSKILFVELALRWGNGLFAPLNSERRKLLEIGAVGHSGNHTVSDIFRYQLGFSPHDERFEVWHASQGETSPPRQLEEYDGVIMSGSEAMVTTIHDMHHQDAPWIRRVLAFDKVLSLSQTPSLLICFSHQLFAFCQGGEVSWMTSTGGNREREIGPVDIQLTERAKSEPLLHCYEGDSLTISATHSQHVSQKPKNADVLASNCAGKNQMLSYKDRPIVSVQNHPEITNAMLAAIVLLRAQAITQERGTQGLADLQRQIWERKTNRPREVLMPNFLTLIGDNS